MARFKVSGVGKVKASTIRKLDSIVKDPILLRDVKEFTIKRIVDTARLGKSLEGTKSQRLLPKLSESYKAQRRGEVYFRTINGRVIPFAGKDPGLKVDGEFFRRNADRSNWTLTGQFLKSIIGKTIRSKTFTGSVAIFPSGRRKDGNRNIQILRWLTDRNKRYEIFSLNQSATRQIKKITQRFLRKKLRSKR